MKPDRPRRRSAWVSATCCLAVIACSGGDRAAGRPDGATSPSVGVAGYGGGGSSGSSTGGVEGTADGSGANIPSSTAGSDARPKASAGKDGNTTGAGDGSTNELDARGDGSTAGHGVGPLSIDFSMWELQLPIGSNNSPTTISSDQLVAGFSNDYFYQTSEGGGQVFMDPATGITTSGSQHCRTEMRELKPGGGSAAWTLQGTNTMTVSGKVLQVGGGASGHVTVAQIFNATDSIPLAELEYATSRGGFELLYEEAKGTGSTVDLLTSVPLNTAYTFVLALSDGVLTANINGKQVFARTPSAATAAKAFYFKVGDYDQTAAAGAVSVVPYTIVEASAVAIVHE
jgi:alginate lyase